MFRLYRTRLQNFVNSYCRQVFFIKLETIWVIHVFVLVL